MGSVDSTGRETGITLCYFEFHSIAVGHFCTVLAGLAKKNKKKKKSLCNLPADPVEPKLGFAGVYTISLFYAFLSCILNVMSCSHLTK